MDTLHTVDTLNMWTHCSGHPPHVDTLHTVDTLDVLTPCIQWTHCICSYTGHTHVCILLVHMKQTQYHIHTEHSEYKSKLTLRAAPRKGLFSVVCKNSTWNGVTCGVGSDGQREPSSGDISNSVASCWSGYVRLHPVTRA